VLVDHDRGPVEGEVLAFFRLPLETSFLFAMPDLSIFNIAVIPLVRNKTGGWSTMTDDI
jgi:hypothetical protein